MRRLHRRLLLARQRLTKKGAKLLDVDLDEVFTSSTNQTPSILKIAQEDRKDRNAQRAKTHQRQQTKLL